MQTRSGLRRTDFQILFAVVLLHLGFYLIWPVIKANASHDRHLPGQLVFLDLPAQKVKTEPSPENRDKQYINKHQSSPTPTTLPSRAMEQASTPSEVRAELPLVSDPAGVVPSPPINRDVRAIFNDIKKDFAYRDQVSAKQPDAPMVKLSKAIAAASAVNRDGTHEETFILADGRPVSKITTPFGTYCILHRKPGATVGNELATVPVSCGNL